MARNRKLRIGVVVAAGGTGKRFGSRTPKQFLRIDGETILERTLRLFDRFPSVSQINLVVPKTHRNRADRILRNGALYRNVRIVEAGRDRQASVRNGLEAFDPAPDLVLVHDAVRPFATRSLVRAVVAAGRRYGAAVPALPVTDTIKREGRRGFLTRTVDRSALWSVQTPQCFDYGLLLTAHLQAAGLRKRFTDDAAVVEMLGVPARIVPGNEENIKITIRADLKQIPGLRRG